MEDLIRRSDAIDAVCEIVPIREDAIEIADAIRAIPSAERPQGEWIDSNGMRATWNFSAFCSVCGEWSEYLTAYCGNCGARMEGADDE